MRGEASANTRSDTSESRSEALQRRVVTQAKFQSALAFRRQVRDDLSPRHRSSPSALQALPTSMRLRTKRHGFLRPFEEWVSYYAGFPLEFAETIIRSFSKTGDTVLDPWNGSGTSTLAAFSTDRRSIGIDLNPYSEKLARARLYCNAPQRFLSAANTALATARRPSNAKYDVALDDPLSIWITGGGLALLRAYEHELRAALTSGCTEASQVRAADAFARVVVARTAVRLTAPARGSNPTWVKRPKQPHPVSRHHAEEAILKEASAAAAVLAGNRHQGTHEPHLIVGDSRSLPIQPASIDLVVASPPYCTRIDYAVATSVELAVLGVDRNTQEFGDLRRTLMGTTCIRPTGPIPDTTSFPASVSSILSQISSHPAYESNGYYLKNLRQYFLDATHSVQSIARSLRRGGSAFLVVQDSFFKDVHIDLALLYADIGTSVGLEPSTVSSQHVPRSLTDINTRTRKAHGRRRYRETVLCLTR